MAKLTKRERQILTYLAQGYVDKETSGRLGISVPTLRTTIRTRLLPKLNARSRAHAVALFLTNGQLPSPASEERQDRDGHPLSRRERQVVLLCAHGLSDSEIADELGLSVNCVRSTYWVRARSKLRAKSRVHAVALLLRQFSSPAEDGASAPQSN
ncbi:MAG: hypothetical protein KatS3mg015_2307 [Fimbriimonadales bacterium]|nr:MAG: hypothetical protein KatS3mg015_2307 [Fimbriimonadales bacterium]